MKRNCNLELRLVTPSVYYHSSDYDGRSRMEGSGSPNEKQQQQMTIFYNGRVAACDVTEHQARSIILLASGEMAEKTDMTIKSPVCSPATTTSDLHMKRSLQRFLEKRKTRAQSTSPYSTVTTHNINHN